VRYRRLEIAMALSTRRASGSVGVSFADDRGGWGTGELSAAAAARLDPHTIAAIRAGKTPQRLKCPENLMVCSIFVLIACRQRPAAIPHSFIALPILPMPPDILFGQNSIDKQHELRQKPREAGRERRRLLRSPEPTPKL